jgi:ABC-type multidrug transport system fused ATPase/permease subunit
MQKHSKTIMVIAHRLSTIRSANNIVVLKYGEIVEQGSHDELVALGGTYKALIDRQMQKAKVEEVLKEEIC